MTEYRIWECQICGWVYDEAKGDPEERLAPGTRWEDIPEDWICPECGVGKSEFEMIEVHQQQSNETNPPHSGSVNNALPIIIIGSGLAGYNLAKAIRQIDQTIPIEMFTTDDGSFYYKPQLSASFAANKTANDLIKGTAEAMAQQLNIKVNIFTHIEKIEPQTKTIMLAHGGSRKYTKLVLALGSNCIDPQLTGNGLSKLHQINNLQDYAKFRTLVTPQDRVLIIGAGLIGCEFADDLTRAGHQINLVDPSTGALANLLPTEASQVLTDNLQQAGIKFHFGTVVKNIEHDENEHQVIATLANGQQLQADVVLSAIGVRPNITLAEQAGIDCHRGIEVDAVLQTSEPDIFAIGDCAEVNGQVLPYVAPINAQTQALAKTLCGDKTRLSYGDMPIVVKTQLHPVKISLPAEIKGQWQFDVNQSTGVNARLVTQQGLVLGYVQTGDQLVNC